METQKKISANINEILQNKNKLAPNQMCFEILMKHLKNNELITDIGNINYSEDCPRLEKFIPINEKFCDNIMVFKIIDSNFSEKTSNRLKIKKSMCGSINFLLRARFKYGLDTYINGIQAKTALYLNSSNCETIKGVKQIMKSDLEMINNKYDNPVVAVYKIQLAHLPLDKLLSNLPVILEQLRKDHCYLLDFDITQDYAGCFNKKEMIQYLKNNDDFVEEDNEIRIDNNIVGIDCLTWTNSNIRAKIYNKFVCQLTSPGLAKQIGNHVLDLVKNKNERLHNTFKSDLAKEHGITRFEITIYNYIRSYEKTTKIKNSIENCKQILDNNLKHFENAPMYSVPLQTMWKKLTDSLQNSCCLIYKNILQYVWWGNSNTKKLTGFQLNLDKTYLKDIKTQETQEPQESQRLKQSIQENDKSDKKISNKEKAIKYILSAFSFNYLPTHLITIEDENIQHKIYIKKGETYFTTSNSMFSIIPKSVKMEDFGLINTDKVIPNALRKTTKITYNLYPFDIVELKDTSITYDDCKNILDCENIKKDKKKELMLLFDQKHIDFNINDTYKIYAYMINNDYVNKKIVYVLAEKDGTKQIYSIKDKKKVIFIENVEKILNSGKFDKMLFKINKNYWDMIYSKNYDYFAELETGDYGVMYNNTKPFPTIKNLFFTNEAKDIVSKKVVNYIEKDIIKETNAMANITGAVTLKEGKKLEDLEEDLELIVTSIKKINFRSRIKYLFNFANDSNLYRSNYWFEKVLENNSAIDQNYRFKIKTGPIKSTPQNHAERKISILFNL